MNRNKEYIESLVNRFFDGETTNEEEKILYEYFSGGEIHPSLESHKELFLFFDGEIQDDLEDFEENSDNATDKKIKRKTHIYTLLVGVVALISTIVMLNPSWIIAIDKNIYEGSYIVENGVRIYDLEEGFIERREKEILAKIEGKKETYLDLVEEVEKTDRKYSTMENNYREKIEEYEAIINKMRNYE